MLALDEALRARDDDAALAAIDALPEAELETISGGCTRRRDKVFISLRAGQVLRHAESSAARP